MRGYEGEVKNTVKEKIQIQVVVFELMRDPSRSLEYNKEIMTCEEKIVRYKCVCGSPQTFDHNTVSKFWVKLLPYVMLRPPLESPNYYPPRELSSKELHKNLQI